MRKVLTYKLPEKFLREIEENIKGSNYQIINCVEGLQFKQLASESEIILIDIDKVPQDEKELLLETISVVNSEKFVYTLFIVGDTSPEKRLEYIQMGVTDLIYDPFLIDELVTKLNNI